MSASVSSFEIENLLKADDTPHPATVEYSDTQTQYISPVSQSYSSGQIMFDCRSARNKWIVFANAYLTLPLRIRVQTGGTAYTEAVGLSWKQSILDFISGCFVTQNGQTLVNDTQQMLYNNLRLKLEHDSGWRDLLGDEYSMVNDSVNYTGLTSGFSNPTNDISTNAGLRQRMIFFKQKSLWNSGQSSFDCLIKIKLADIHTFFSQLDFPIINQNFAITFFINNQNVQYPSMNCSATTAGTVNGITYVGLAAPQPPQISIDAGGISLDGVNYPEPRIYYNAVSFRSELVQQIAGKMKSGFTKKIRFYESDLYRLPAVASGSVSGTIVNSVSAPNRIFIYSVPANNLTTTTGIVSSVGKFTSVAFTVNNTPVFQLNPQTPQELYQLLLDETSNVGSSIAPAGITFQEFMSSYSIVCCNLSKRMRDKMMGNENVSIAVSLTPAAGVPSTLEYYAIVERKLSMVLNMSENGVVFDQLKSGD